MSGDMMQALSGSSLLSLSFGTLPAVKAGMNLDANPFASQLALMTGPETAIGGSAVSVAADSEFVLALADVLETPVAAGSADPAVSPQAATEAIVAAPALPKAGDAGVASPRIAPAPVVDDVVPLPSDATPSQIIEAVMNGSAAKPAIDSRATTTATRATAALPADPAEPIQPAAPSAPPPVIADMQKMRPQPMVAGDADPVAPAQSYGAVMSDAVEPELSSPETDESHPRRAVKAVEVEAKLADPAIIVPAITPVTTPVVVAPDAAAPETGTTRVAISTAPAPVSAAAGEEIAAQSADVRATADRAITPVQSGGADSVATATPVTPRATAAALHAPAPSPVALSSDALVVFDSTPAAAMPAPAPVASARAAATPAAASPAAATQVASTPVTVTPSGATPAPAVVDAPKQADTMAAAPAQASSAPAPVVASQNTAAAPTTAAAPAATATTALSSQPARVATPAPRGVTGTAAQRAVQAAVQSPQPAQALAALFNLSDAGAEPAPVEAISEMPAALRAEAVQPSWISALNAVTTPVNSPAVQTLTAPNAAAAAQAPFESIAFDAAFIGNIETQISRVMGGGQMVRMQIMPEHLGRIDIEMLAGPDRDQVRLVTEHDAVRDTLVQSQVRLEQDLRQNGQRHAEVTVELRQQSAGTQGGSPQQQRGQAGPETAAQRDAAQRQNSAATNDTQTPAQRRPRGNVRYA